ncbi:MAG: hypothetical protein C0425_00700 [Chlorobiaceae bacterium]|nr:hypothetical protein [Chlorobiaceae bacterium]MBA4308841.1 hypothetical protein [Chlorobiaceae bacterium]
MLRVKDLPLDDRPREKLKFSGPQNLSDSELIAILLRTGKQGKTVIDLAKELLKTFETLSHLSTQSINSMTKLSGIGNDKAVTLLAAFELSRRISSKNRWFSDIKITSPSDVAELFIPLLRNEVVENFIVICLNTSNQVIRYKKIFIGNLNSSIVHPREIFKFAIENNSKSIILIHNHPSGNLEASREDIAITKKLVEVGKIFEIPVNDHLIIAGDSYFSFVEQKLI